MKKYLLGLFWLLASITILGCEDRTPAEIELIPNRVFSIGALVPLEVGIKNKAGDILNEIKVTYSSSRPNILDVSPEGVLRCYKYGYVDIKIAAYQLEKTISVVCMDGEIVEILRQSSASKSNKHGLIYVH